MTNSLDTRKILFHHCTQPLEILLLRKCDIFFKCCLILFLKIKDIRIVANQGTCRFERKYRLACTCPAGQWSTQWEQGGCVPSGDYSKQPMEIQPESRRNLLYIFVFKNSTCRSFIMCIIY